MRESTQAYAVIVCDHDRGRREPTRLTVTEVVANLGDAQAAAVRCNADRRDCSVFYFVRAMTFSDDEIGVVDAADYGQSGLSISKPTGVPQPLR